MNSTGVPLFSAAALVVLDRLPFDPTLRSRFEIMSGALMWRDEFPRPNSSDWKLVMPNYVYRYLLAYRASITLGEEQAGFRPVWEQVARYAPGWTGLRPERRGVRERRRL